MASPAVDVERVKRYGFSEFVKLAWNQIEACELIYEPHMDLVCSHYAAVTRGEIRDLVVNVPPGTSKSTIGSVLYPCWEWTVDPTQKHIFVSYDEKLSHDFAKRAMQLMQGEWFQARWPYVQIEGGERAPVGLFKNTKGGVRFSTMMGGAATGRHGHKLFVDDAHKPDDLKGGGDSAAAALDLAWQRYTETFCRRVADAHKFARIVTMQRLHEEDLAGRMLKDPKVVHLCLPMEFEPQRAYKSEKWGSDLRTVEGELLCPKRFPAEYIDDIKNGPTGMTTRAYAAQMQQRPSPEAGALFMRESFTQRWEVLPVGGRFIMSVDASLKDNRDSDYCVLQVWYYKGAEYYLVDQVRERMAFSATVEAIKTLKMKWPKIGQVIVEQKANGDAIIDTLKRAMPGVLGINPEGGKFARANAVEPMLRAMNCRFPLHTKWLGGYIEEFACFPVGSNDDQVDATTQALLFMSGRTRGQTLKKAMSNVRNGLTMGRPRR